MIGSRLGSYEITAKLGEGGMGEVYRATDTKLKREVAIKVLPPAFTADAERLQRFEREAQLLAQLHHPHIASIFGLEESGGIRALVMELVEGPTLAERLEPGALPLDETLSIARQIAEALEEAHEKGIVHRDLKPQNVKVTADGKVKVLDFGLAKAMDPAGAASGSGSSSQLAASPTLTLGATVQGLILGTAAYMAPEQAKGGAVDKRADIWAFGVVLHEMLTGARLFDAPTVPETLAQVLTRSPDLDALPAATPPSVRQLLRRCLERNPKERLRDIGDARLALDDLRAGRDAVATEATAGAAAPGVRRAGWRLAMAALAGVALGAAGVATWLGTRPTPSPPATRTTLRLPEGVAPSSLDRPIAISPDGSRLVLAARSDARELLWLRNLGDLRWQELAGTEDASYPFWSPDGGSLGFFANGKLKRLDLATGVVRTLCDAAVGRGATWGSRGTIVFSPGAVGPLQQVSADGGTPAALLPTARDGEDQRNPHFLPDGRSFLFWARNRGAPGERAIYAFDAGRGGAKKLLDNPAEAIYVEPGYLAFVADGNLMLQPFDAGRLALSGSPRPVAANVRFTGIRSWIAVALAPDGLLVYQDAPGEPPFQLLWAELGGAETPAWEGALGVRVEGAFLSPDGRRAASYWVGPGAAVHSEILDFGAGTRSRLGTLRQDRNLLPAWFPSGDRVAVRAMVDGEFQLGWMPAGPDEEVRPLTSTTGLDYGLGSVTPDGRSILFSRASDTDQLGDIYLVDVEGGAPPRLVLGGPGQESGPRLSPDGRWLAFVSEGSGRREIWVTDFPAATGRWQVSSNTEERGARVGRWGWLSADELWWRDADGRLVAASLAWRGREIEIGARRLLLGGRALADTETVFDYSPVRNRFLMGREVGPRTASELVVVSDWRAALRAGERSP